MHALRPSDARSEVELLSKREREVLALAASGLLDKEITTTLDVSSNTLRTHWTRIKSKLGSLTRTALVSLYVRSEWEAHRAAWAGQDVPEGVIVDATTGMTHATDGVNDLHELERGVPHHISEYRKNFHPEDVDAAFATFHQLIDGVTDSSHLVFRLVPPTGIVTIHVTMFAVRDSHGTVKHVFGYRIPPADCPPEADVEVRVGSWIRELPSGRFFADDDYYSLFDVEPDCPDPVEAVLSRIHPGDADGARSFSADAIASGRVTDQLFARVKTRSGGYAWARSRIRIERDGLGGIRVIGSVAVFR